MHQSFQALHKLRGRRLPMSAWDVTPPEAMAAAKGQEHGEWWKGSILCLPAVRDPLVWADVQKSLWWCVPSVLGASELMATSCLILTWDPLCPSC
jgi:hypothetical protein